MLSIINNTGVPRQLPWAAGDTQCKASKVAHLQCYDPQHELQNHMAAGPDLKSHLMGKLQSLVYKHKQFEQKFKAPKVHCANSCQACKVFP